MALEAATISFHSMTKKKFIILLLLAVLAACTSGKKKESPKLLIFSKTAGYRHQSIEHGREVLAQLAEELGYQVSATEDAGMFTPDSLAAFGVVVFLNTTGDVLNEVQQEAFEQYMSSGGGFLGIHAAADTEYEWPWYGKLVGGYFDSHPNDPNVRKAEVRKEAEHPIVAEIPSVWQRSDEWYNYKEVNQDIYVLLSLDESTYEGGTMGEEHPIAWWHDYGGGRAFYTGMGHTAETYDEPLVQDMLRKAIKHVSSSVTTEE